MTTDITTNARIVEATKAHIPFVAWTMMAAARSHLPIGMFDLYLGRPEAEVLRYCEAATQTPTVHFGHYSGFIVAEVDGKPAAALSGYFDEERGGLKILEGLAEADATYGVTREELGDNVARALSIANCTQEHAPNAWIIEWVATAPDFRRRGLVDALLERMLDIGRAKGASVADIGVYIGNDPAQRAYEKAGFEVIGEKRDAAFEAAYGTPGVRHMRRAL